MCKKITVLAVAVALLLIQCSCRINPDAPEGTNPFTLDSKEPDWSKFQDFIKGEVRYASLLKTFPQEAEELFSLTEKYAKLRYEGYKKLAGK